MFKAEGEQLLFFCFGKAKENPYRVGGIDSKEPLVYIY